MSWRLEKTCSHSNSSERPSANSDVKNSKGVNNNNYKKNKYNKNKNKKNNNDDDYNMVPQSWIIYCLKMNKISDELYQESHENLKSGSDSWKENLAGAKTQKVILQGGVLSPLLFVIVRMPLNHILGKYTAG